MTHSETIPFSEPPWLSGHPSPFYNDSHREWQRYCRAFIDDNLSKYAMDWEREEEVPIDVYGRQLQESLRFAYPHLADEK